MGAKQQALSIRLPSPQLGGGRAFAALRRGASESVRAQHISLTCRTKPAQCPSVRLPAFAELPDCFTGLLPCRYLGPGRGGDAADRMRTDNLNNRREATLGEMNKMGSFRIWIAVASLALMGAC